MEQPDRAAEPHFTRPSARFLLMLVVLALVGVGGVLGPAQGAAGLPRQPLPQPVHPVRLRDRPVRDALAGRAGARPRCAGSDGYRARAPGPRPEQPAAAAGAARRPAARARRTDADRRDLGAVDPRLGRDPDRRRARHHPLHHQPFDFPRSSRHLLRSRHDRAGGGRHHPARWRPTKARAASRCSTG